MYVPAHFKEDRVPVYHTALLDIDGLYYWIEHYIDQCRPALLRHFPDPETFFVRRVETGIRSAALDAYAFYDVWVLMIQQYGIYNPFTTRGAIKGCFPTAHTALEILSRHTCSR
jgi:hypothetical protein